MRRVALVLILLVPTASALSFEVSVEDARGDVRTADQRAIDFPTADILSFSSAQEGDRVVQRVEVAAPPRAPGDSILVRTWFENSTNGSFHTIDLLVRGDATADARFRPVVRDGAFEDATPIEGALYRVENATWVFSFDAALLANATCYYPGAFSEHGQRAGHRGFDQAFDRASRACVTAPEPNTAPTPTSNAPSATTPASPVATPPPGSETPGPAWWLALAATGVALTLRRSARRS